MFFLGIHGGYKEISVGIFAAQVIAHVIDSADSAPTHAMSAGGVGTGSQKLEQVELELVESEIIPNAQASKQLVFVIAHVLKKQNLCLEDLAFIFVNQGPAPFTTLRTVLSTVNALSFARHIPLVGIDSLKALAAESSSVHTIRAQDNNKIITVALLDAFNSDVYYCFKADAPEIVPDKSGPEYKPGLEYKTGYENISAFVLRLQKFLENGKKNNPNTRLCLIGNGAELHRQALETALGNGIVWAESMPLTASFNCMAQSALQDFNTGQISSKLSPLYLKLHAAELAKQQ
jgi:tRNA threonylcarbamoyl adenosine modification protein YeaZ